MIEVKKLVEAVQAHAIKHYAEGRGWDYVVECWGSDEIAAEIAKVGNVVNEADAIALFASIAGDNAEAELNARCDM